MGLGILWAVGDLVHRKTENLRKQRLTLARALTRIDMSSVLFFIDLLIGLVSAIVDNVPLVALFWSSDRPQVWRPWDWKKLILSGICERSARLHWWAIWLGLGCTSSSTDCLHNQG